MSVELDEKTKAHLDKWLELKLFPEEHDQARADIMKALDEVPELIEMGYTWQEIRERGKRC